MKLTQQLHRFPVYKLGIALSLLTAVISCQKELHFDKEPEKDHNLIIKFKPVVQYDSVALEFGKSYTNYFKEPYTPTAFKFYVHNFEMINTDSGRVFRLPFDRYFLVDFADSASTEVKIGILPYVYNRISFTIGVDSATTMRGPYSGALDTALGMYWNRSAGYVFAKLEGTSPRSPQGGRFEFSIGGYSGTDNAAKKVNLLFPYAQNLDLKPGKTSEMFITCDAHDWFFQPHDIKIADNPIVVAPGELAKKVAENYSKMYTVDSVANE